MLIANQQCLDHFRGIAIHHTSKYTKMRETIKECLCFKPHLWTLVLEQLDTMINVEMSKSAARFHTAVHKSARRNIRACAICTILVCCALVMLPLLYKELVAINNITPHPLFYTFHRLFAALFVFTLGTHCLQICIKNSEKKSHMPWYSSLLTYMYCSMKSCRWFTHREWQWHLNLDTRQS